MNGKSLEFFVMCAGGLRTQVLSGYKGISNCWDYVVSPYFDLFQRDDFFHDFLEEYLLV